MSENPFEIIPLNNDDAPEFWDITRLPQIKKDIAKATHSELNGENDINNLLQLFSNYLDISKRVNSFNTRRNYLSNSKQFLHWCNLLNYSIERVKTTQDLRNLIIVYNKALLQSDIQQNTVALKMQSIRKFFEFVNFKELKLDLRSAFNPDWITTQDTNAFKKQVRINEDVYKEVCDYVNDECGIDDKWILFFFAFGCRRSEISTAKISDIDKLNKCINLYMVKTQDIKKLPLPDWYNSVSDFEENQIFIVTNNSKRTKKTKGIKPVTTQHIYNICQKWLDNISFKGDIKLTPHSFRRYFINTMQKKGYSDSSISKISGHKSVQMISRYAFDTDLINNPIVSGDAVDY